MVPKMPLTLIFSVLRLIQHSAQLCCRTLMGRYKINVKDTGLTAGLKQLYKMLKQRTSLEFEALPDMDACTDMRVSSIL